VTSPDDAATVDPSQLDVGLLASFVGYAAQDVVLADLAEAGFGDLRVAHGFIVQHLLGGARTVTELAELQSVSVQAISKTTSELIALGYVASTVDPDDGRSRRLSLTERGHASVAASRAARRRVQRRVSRRLGADRVTALSADLVSVLDLLGGVDAVSQRRVRRPS